MIRTSCGQVFLSLGRSPGHNFRMNNDLLPELVAAVEQQLVSPQTPYVAKTYDRLIKLGVPEQEAKEQIALCLGQESDAAYRKRRGFDEKAYKALLNELPVAADEEE